MLVKGQVTEEVSVVSKRTGGSAFFDSAKGGEERLRAEGEGGAVLEAGAGTGVVRGRASGRAVFGIWFRVEGVLYMGDGGGVKGGNRCGLGEDFEGAAKFVHVGKGLRLA